MSQQSNIEWTDATWNPTTGCTKVSPGCANCYIERTPAFRIAGRKFVKGHIPLVLHDDRVTQPLHWKKPRRVFVNSLSDLFHDDVPTPFIDRVFKVMQRTPQHQFQVLTKRPERMRRYLTSHVPVPWGGYSWPEPHGKHVWVGVSVENRAARWRIGDLRQTPAAVRFLSCEPLLEDLRTLDLSGIQWVIVGGESGPKARACDVAWIRAIVRQCRAAGVPVFVKQLGALVLVPACRQSHWDYRFVNRPEHQRFTDFSVDRWRMRLRHIKGGDPDEWPADLRVREFPVGA